MIGQFFAYDKTITHLCSSTGSMYLESIWFKDKQMLGYTLSSP